jgi:hypothetical protein
MRLSARWSVPAGTFLVGMIVGGTLVFLNGGYRRDAPPPRRLEATIYLPTRGNSQKPFSEKDWHSALQLLVVEFGGATLGTPVEGYWQDSQGQLQREPVRPVIVSFEREKLARFRKVVQDVGRKLGQETIYTRFEEPRVELLPVHSESLSEER